MNKKERAAEILKRLRKTYQRKPDSFVQWSTPLELVVGTVLSAQCTDKRVNMVTKELFQKYRTPEEYAKANLQELQKEIGSITFYKSKAKYLKGIGKLLVDRHNSTVPKTFAELIQLPGVAKKTATLIMAKAYGKHTGIAVDTHVKRVAPRLGLTPHTDPDKISLDLEKLYPEEDYLDVNEFMILHGRATCAPRIPKCQECPLQDICPSATTYIHNQ